MRIGAIDSIAPEPSDLVILSTPVGDILQLLETLKPGPQIILDMEAPRLRSAERLRTAVFPLSADIP